MIKAEIITIGDEILYGQTTDTNATWISSRLDALGIRVNRRTTIGDDEEDMMHTFARAKKRVDLVIITGGLGPTNDDLTKPVLTKFFDTEMKLNKEALEDIEKLFKKLGREVTETNRKQAELPVNCDKITNKFGTAPGMWFDEDDTVFVSMPGVPYEMKKMMTDYIIPRLQDRFDTPVIFHKIIKTVGIGESWLSDKIKEWEESLPDNIRLAYLPSLGRVKLRLTATGEDREKLEKEVQKEVDRLQDYAEEYIYGYDSDELEAVVGKMLKEENLTLSVAESCSGGYLSHLITSISGSSDYFRGGIISYANKVKIEQLGVDKTTLEKYGAVSEETVTEMSRGIRKKLGTDIGIATSGIAGPTGGTEEKPVGTIWIAVSDGQKTITKKLTYGKDRMINIQFTAISALNLLRQRLREKAGESALIP